MSRLAALLDDAVEREQLVGAQLAVLHRGVLDVAVAGVADVQQRRPVTEQTRFEIGSVTKPLVAAALLLAQDEGLVDLDAPVAERVPELRPRDPRAAGVTPRQVLSHTSGLAGDYFPDTGDGPDAIARYVALLAQQPLDVAPGTTVSYSNGAYVLAGRLLECVTRQPFAQALRSLVLLPAGGAELGTWDDPDDEHLAHGHALSERGPVASTRRYPSALLPAGGVLAAAGPLSRVVRSLTVAPEAPLPQWLPGRSRERLAPVATRPGTSLGWGWAVSSADGRVLLAHDGGTYGASSFVRVLPESDLVLVLLTNRTGVAAAGHALLDRVLEEMGQAPISSPAAEPAGAAPAVDQVLGAYRRTGGAVEVDLRDGSPYAVLRTDDDEVGSTQVEGPLSVRGGSWQLDGVPLAFLGSDAEPASCAVVGVRAHTRVSPPPAPGPAAPR